MKKLLFILGCLLSTLHSFSQSDVAGIFGHQRAAGRYVGWSPAVFGSVAGSLEVRNDFINQPINFFTTNTGVPIQRMTILGTTGFVGINTPSPNQLFTVSAGNINVTNTTQNNGYMIGNVMTLWRGSIGNINNIFVGANSGTANTSGLRNTFVGSNSGAANTTAPDNTFIGFNTGLTIDNARVE